MIQLFNIFVMLLDGGVGAFVLYQACSGAMGKWPNWIRIPTIIGGIGLILQSVRCGSFLWTGIELSEYDQLCSWFMKDLGLVFIVLSVTRNISEKEGDMEFLWDNLKWIKWSILTGVCLADFLINGSMVDEYITLVGCIVVSVIIFFVHRHRDEQQVQTNAVLKAANEAIEINVRLQERIVELERGKDA